MLKLLSRFAVNKKKRTYTGFIFFCHSKSQVYLKTKIRGGRCWFLVKSNLFDILVEIEGEKRKGVVFKRSGGCSLWIQFGGRNLGCLM